MKTATIKLRMDKIGCEVDMQRVTPPEAMFLIADHHMNAGGDPIVSLQETDDVERTPAQERRRLAAKYGQKRVAKFYPGPIPTMPTTFEEAREAGVSQSAPTERLLTVGEEGGIS